jgi:DNA-directed RNA polymerase subunit RPC12/RpoP
MTAGACVKCGGPGPFDGDSLMERAEIVCTKCAGTPLVASRIGDTAAKMIVGAKRRETRRRIARIEAEGKAQP